MDVKVSVIVPTLNSSKYIEECIDSIISQTLKNIEIICVDAGSSDGTVELIEEYMKSDSRIKLMYSDKRSYGYQMNLGISNAKGRYIGIVESDDAIEKEMYEELYSIADGDDLDFVKADYHEFHNTPDNNEYTFRRRYILKQQDLYNIVIDASSKPEILLPDIVAIWNGIYRKDFLIQNNIAFNETPGASFQDTGFWVWTQVAAKKGYYLNKPFYRYRVDNPNSSTFQASKCFCICDEFAYIHDMISREKLSKFAEMLSWIFYRKYKTNLERTPTDLRKEFFVKMADDFLKWNNEFEVTGKFYYQEEWEDLRQIMSAPKQYDEQKEKEKREFLESLKVKSEIVIYGAGRTGKIIAREIGPDKVSCFAVTSSESVREVEIEGSSIPIKCITDLDNVDCLFIVISTKLANLREEMLKMTMGIGAKNVALIPYGAFDE